jgi:predicted Zn finger-like uncharacterized protein
MSQRRREWQFFQGAGDEWTWRVQQPDGPSKMSKASFPSFVTCVADAINNGYVLLPFEDRRMSGRRGREAMICQEVTCPHCGATWELGRGRFAATGEALRCASCNAEFEAAANSVTCCIQDDDGLRELPLS